VYRLVSWSDRVARNIDMLILQQIHAQRCEHCLIIRSTEIYILGRREELERACPGKVLHRTGLLLPTWAGLAEHPATVIARRLRTPSSYGMCPSHDVCCELLRIGYRHYYARTPRTQTSVGHHAVRLFARGIEFESPSVPGRCCDALVSPGRSLSHTAKGREIVLPRSQQ
jgi:hypothetical protein